MEFVYATYFTGGGMEMGDGGHLFWSCIREVIIFFTGAVFHIPLPLKPGQVNTSNPRRKGNLEETHVWNLSENKAGARF